MRWTVRSDEWKWKSFNTLVTTTYIPSIHSYSMYSPYTTWSLASNSESHPWDLLRVYETFIYLFEIANLWGRTMCGLAYEGNLNIYKPIQQLFIVWSREQQSWNSTRRWAENICTRGKKKSQNSLEKKKIKQSRPLCCVQLHILQTPFKLSLPSQQSFLNGLLPFKFGKCHWGEVKPTVSCCFLSPAN